MTINNVVASDGFTSDPSGNRYRFRIGDVRNVSGTVTVGYEWERLEGGQGGYIGGVYLENAAGDELASDEIRGGITGAPASFEGELSASASPGDTLQVVLETDLISDLSFTVPPVTELENALALRIEKNNEGPYSRGNPLDYTAYVENQLGAGAGGAQFDFEYPIDGSEYTAAPVTDRLQRQTLAPGERLEVDAMYPDPDTDGSAKNDTLCFRVSDASVGGESIPDMETCIDVNTTESVSPRDLLFGGEFAVDRAPSSNTSQLLKSSPLYVGPGGEVNAPIRVGVSTDAPSTPMAADVRYVERITNVEAGETVKTLDTTLRGIEWGDDRWVRGRNNEQTLTWPAEWDEPFTFRFTREAYLLNGPAADTETPAIAETIDMPAIVDSDPPEPDPEPPEPDPEPPEPTVPPTEVSCDYDGSEIVAGESATIPATVTAGAGDTDASVTARFEVAGATASETVTVSPGGSVSVEATFEISEPGEYQPTVTLE